LNDQVVNMLICVCAYCAGGIHFAALLGKAIGHDLRHVGSGNVGATNLARVAGLRWGLAAFLLDALKGYGPVLLAGVSPWPGLPVLAGALAILGHCFSPFARFRGGKGVATAAGVLIGLDAQLAALLLAFWGLALAVFRNVGISSSLTASVGLAVGLVQIWKPGSQGEVLEGFFLVGLGVLVVVRHRRNIHDFFVRAGRGGAEQSS